MHQRLCQYVFAIELGLILYRCLVGEVVVHEEESFRRLYKHQQCRGSISVLCFPVVEIVYYSVLAMMPSALHIERDTGVSG